MRKALIAAACAALVLGCGETSAQTAQDELDARYDRALAAGYKALFLCSAMANAEHYGAERSEGSIERWELTGIQAPLDDIVRELPAFIERGEDGVIDYVLVEWADTAHPRIAMHRPDRGCSIMPMGTQLRWEPDSEIFTRSAVRMSLDPRAAQTDETLARRGFSPDYGAEARTTAVAIQKGGVLLSEAYGPDHGPNVPQRTWSVAKSIAATVVGAAVQRGEADVFASAGLGAGVDDPRRAITIDDALRMASGRYSDTPGNRTDPLYWGGTSVDERAQNWPLMTSPGRVYRYANNDTLAAVKAIESTFETVSPNDLLARIGMRMTIAETDSSGNYVLSSQVWTTARDLLRLGQLHLDGGVLPDGTRILPEGWTRYISSPSGPQPEGRGWGYGAGWWLFNRSEGIPPDTFLAAGNRGQYVVVVPSRDIVIVRRGEDMVGTRFDIEAFTRDILAAIDE